MKRISDYVAGRDNNFNLIRFLAAGTVVFAHSFLIATGDRGAGPLIAATGHNLGYHAVNVFFSASGFLIARSWLNAGSVPGFMAARMLRLWPALAFCAIFLAFVIGPLLTALPLSSYFGSPATYEFIPQVLGLINADLPLPGVETPVPADASIDAPLWTLKYEVMCYTGVLLLGVFGMFSPRRFRRSVGGLMMTLFVLSLLPLARDRSHPWEHMIRFGLCFGFGTIAYVEAKRIPLAFRGVVAALAAAVLLRPTVFYEFALYIFTAYTTIWVAFVPASFIRSFNRLGDYSYGIYIFAYPIQLLLMHFQPKSTPFELFMRTVPIVLALSVASWTFIERPSLRYKKALALRLGAFMRGWTDRGWWASRP